MRAVKDWRYRPYTVKGKPAEIETEITNRGADSASEAKFPAGITDWELINSQLTTHYSQLATGSHAMASAATFSVTYASITSPTFTSP